MPHYLAPVYLVVYKSKLVIRKEYQNGHVYNTVIHHGAANPRTIRYYAKRYNVDHMIQR